MPSAAAARPARWVAPVVLAAIAASVLALLVVAGRRDEAVEERPADLPFDVLLVRCRHTCYDGGPMTGAGGNCVALVGQDGIPAQGCLAGDQGQLGRAGPVTVVDGNLRTIVSPGHTGVHGQEDDFVLALTSLRRTKPGSSMSSRAAVVSRSSACFPIEPGEQTDVVRAQGDGPGCRRRRRPATTGVTYLFDVPDADPPSVPRRGHPTRLGEHGSTPAARRRLSVR